MAIACWWMLTDEQIAEKALAHLRRFGQDLRLSRPVPVSAPDGVFYKVARSANEQATTLVSPFVILRNDGRIVSISAGDVMPGVVTKVWGRDAMRTDPALQQAIIEPDFDNPNHVDVWTQIIREVCLARGIAAT